MFRASMAVLLYVIMNFFLIVKVTLKPLFCRILVPSAEPFFIFNLRAVSSLCCYPSFLPLLSFDNTFTYITLSQPCSPLFTLYTAILPRLLSRQQPHDLVSRLSPSQSQIPMDAPNRRISMCLTLLCTLREWIRRTIGPSFFLSSCPSCTFTSYYATFHNA